MSEEYEKRTHVAIRQRIKDSEYDRTYSIWSADEDEALLNLFVGDKLSLLEIAKKLRRTLGSIRARLRLHGLLAEKGRGFGSQFAEYIREGVNPITGEHLSEDSAWRHPKILADLRKYVGKAQEPPPKKGKKPKSANASTIKDREWLVISALIQNLEQYVPGVNKRDAKIMRRLYDRSGTPPTLEEVGRLFDISRERVRQIREKYLKRLRVGVLRGEFRHPHKVKHSGLEEQHSSAISGKQRDRNIKDMASSYMNSVLLTISAKESWAIKTPKSTALENQVRVTPASTTATTERNSSLGKEEFFRIEHLDSYTPFKNKTKASTVTLNKEKLLKRREENLRAGRLINQGNQVTWEEVYEIKNLYYRGFDLQSLESYFQRSSKSIELILEKSVKGYIRSDANP